MADSASQGSISKGSGSEKKNPMALDRDIRDDASLQSSIISLGDKSMKSTASVSEVLELAMILIDKSFDEENFKVSDFKLLRVGALLADWSYLQEGKMSISQDFMMARVHHMIWLISPYTQLETYNLQRAIEQYETCFSVEFYRDDINCRIEYCTLMHTLAFHKRANELTTAAFEPDQVESMNGSQKARFLLLSCAVKLALEHEEQAEAALQQCIALGPLGPLSKADMLLLQAYCRQRVRESRSTTPHSPAAMTTPTPHSPAAMTTPTPHSPAAKTPTKSKQASPMPSKPRVFSEDVMQAYGQAFAVYVKSARKAGVGGEGPGEGPGAEETKPAAEAETETLTGWLSDRSTWSSLAQKIALFGLFGLCADLYLEAIKRVTVDRAGTEAEAGVAQAEGDGAKAVNNVALANLWGQVGKMRARAGDVPGAALAMNLSEPGGNLRLPLLVGHVLGQLTHLHIAYCSQEAAVLDPSSRQFAVLLNLWAAASGPTTFQSLVDGPLENILDLLHPAHEDPTERSAAQIQSAFRGWQSRRDNSRPNTRALETVGEEGPAVTEPALTMDVFPEPPEDIVEPPEDIVEPLENIVEPLDELVEPLEMYVESLEDVMKRSATCIQSAYRGWRVQQSLGPVVSSRCSSVLRQDIVIHRRYPLNVRFYCDALGVIRKVRLVDPRTGQHRFRTLRPLAPPMCRAGKAGPASGPEVSLSYHMHESPYTDLPESLHLHTHAQTDTHSHSHISRMAEVHTFLLSYQYRDSTAHESTGSHSHRHTGALNARTWRHTLRMVFPLDGPLIPEPVPADRPVFRALSSHIVQVDEAQSITSDAETCAVARGVRLHRSHLLVFEVVQVGAQTRVDLTHPAAGGRVRLLFPREHMSSVINIRIVLGPAFAILQSSPWLWDCLLGRTVEGPPCLRTSMLLGEKLLCIRSSSDKFGAVLRVVDSEGKPVLGDRFEVVPSALVAPLHREQAKELHRIGHRAKATEYRKEVAVTGLMVAGLRGIVFSELTDIAYEARRTVVSKALRRVASDALAHTFLRQQADRAQRVCDHRVATSEELAMKVVWARKHCTGLKREKTQSQLVVTANRAKTFLALRHKANTEMKRNETQRLLAVVGRRYKATVSMRRTCAIAKRTVTASLLSRNAVHMQTHIALVGLADVAKDEYRAVKYLLPGLLERAEVQAVRELAIEEEISTQVLAQFLEQTVAHVTSESMKFVVDEHAAVLQKVAMQCVEDVLERGMQSEYRRRLEVLQSVSRQCVKSAASCAVRNMRDLILSTTKSIAKTTVTDVVDSSIGLVLQLRERLSSLLMDSLVIEAVDDEVSNFVRESRYEIIEELLAQREKKDMAREELRSIAVWAELKMIADERRRAKAARKHLQSRPTQPLFVPRGSSESRIQMFLEHQTKRMLTADWLIIWAAKARLVSSRNWAHEFLVGRVAHARELMTFLTRSKSSAKPRGLGSSGSINRPGSRSPMSQGSNAVPQLKRGGPPHNSFHHSSFKSNKSASSPSLERQPSSSSLNSLGKEAAGVDQKSIAVCTAPTPSQTEVYPAPSPSPSKRERGRLAVAAKHRPHPVTQPAAGPENSRSKSKKRPTDPFDSAQELLDVLGVSAVSKQGPEDFPAAYESLSQVTQDCMLLKHCRYMPVEAAGSIPPVRNVTKRDPVRFLGSRTASLTGPEPANFEDSLVDFRKYGYSSGETAFAKKWQSRLDEYVMSLESADVLGRQLSKLQHTHSADVSREVALLALADTRGAFEEALGRLANAEFCEEAELVCSILPAPAILSSVPASASSGPQTTSGPSSRAHATGSAKSTSSVFPPVSPYTMANKWAVRKRAVEVPITPVPALRTAHWTSSSTAPKTGALPPVIGATSMPSLPPVSSVFVDVAVETQLSKTQAVLVLSKRQAARAKEHDRILQSEKIVKRLRARKRTISPTNQC